MPSTPCEVRFIPITVPAAIRPEDVDGQDCGPFIVRLLREAGVSFIDQDVLAVSSKVVSFLDGGLVRLDDVVPSRKARILAWLFGRDPRKTQLVLEQGRVMMVVPMGWVLRIPALREMMIRRSGDATAMLAGFAVTNAFTFIVKKHAAYLDEAGIDLCNSPEGYVTLLPENPCQLAARIRVAIADGFGADVAVILTDTVTTVGRVGSQDMAIGYAGIDPVKRETFSLDLFGTPRSGGINLTIDSVAAMAGHVMGQTTERTPFVLVRGVAYSPERDDELPGMQAIAWPQECERRLAWMVARATLKYWLGSLLACQRRTPKKRRTGC